jgi:transcriptional regulator with XRE-family HTH domain
MSEHRESSVTEVDGLTVRRLRQERKLTQQALADAIGKSRGWVSVIETSAAKRVSTHTARGLAAALTVPVDALQVAPTRVTRTTGVRFGAALPSGSTDRLDLIRRALRQTEEMRVLLEQVLRAEEEQ